MKKLKISPIFFFKELMLCEINYKNILQSIKTQNFDVRGLKTAKIRQALLRKKLSYLLKLFLSTLPNSEFL